MSIVHARRGAVLLLLPVLVLVVGPVPATGADVSPQQAAPPEFAGMKHVPAGEFGMGLDEKAAVVTWCHRRQKKYAVRQRRRRPKGGIGRRPGV